MLIQPADGSPGIFVDRLAVASVVPSLSEYEPDGAYLVTHGNGATVTVSKEHGERLLADIAGK